MATNPLDKVYLTQAQLNTLAGGGSITSGSDTYTADESTLYLTPDTSISFESQTLTNEQKAQARTNIGAGTGSSNFSGSYNDLTDKPTIPTTTDSVTQSSTAALTSGGAYTALSGKQATLVSGTNIKTINNESILGSGNIAIGASSTMTVETYTVSSWTALANSSPYTYQATVTATAIIGNDTIVELINNQAVLFAQHGFAIGSISGQNITIYSIDQPSSSVTLKIGLGG